MKKVTDQKLERIMGGGSPYLALGIIAAIVFISGVIEGIVHPNACSSS